MRKLNLQNLNLQRFATIATIALCLLTHVASIASAKQATESSEEQKTLVPSVLPGELRSYELDSWSTLAIRAQNFSDSEANGMVSVFLEDDNRSQYSRRYWVPANATRYTWLPIRTPAKVEREKANLVVSVLDLNESDGEVTLQRRRGDQLASKTFLRLVPPGRNIGWIGDRSIGEDAPDTRSTPNEVSLLADAVRRSDGGDSTLSKLSCPTQFLPPFPAAYDGLDQLIISTDRLATESGGLAAIRNWIFNGGHAWIMADRVDSNTIRMLLGNSTPFETIDRIELNEFSVKTPRPAGSKVPEEEAWSSVDPVDFLRVSTTSVDVYSSIDGWPASFSVPLGQGRVFITTLSARGWSYPTDLFSARPNFDQNDSSLPNSRRTKTGPTLALQRFADQFNEMPGRQSPLGENLKPILLEQIGYKIPSRSIAALLLGLSCVAIAGLGFWLARKQQLDKLALVVPACTTVCALVLIFLGNANRSSVPATASSLRLAQVDTTLNTVRSNTLTGFYSPTTTDIPLESNEFGIADPDIDGLAGVAKRTTWDDQGMSNWDNISVAAGSIRFANIRENLSLDQPIHARASFNADGLEGKILGIEQLGELEDAIVRSPSAPSTAVNIEQSGKFQVRPADLLAKGEFITNTILSDKQQRRQSQYRAILDGEQSSYSPQAPTLFAWSENDDLGFKTPESFQPSGGTLFAIPLEIERTPANRPFLIPASLVRTSPVNPQAKQLYNAKTRTWLKNVNFNSEVMMRFVVPPSVVPCQITTAKLKLKINAPSRTIELLCFQNGQRKVIQTRESPSGVIELDLGDRELLQLDEQSGLQFGFSVSRTYEQIKEIENAQIANWQVDYMQLEVNGVTD